MITRMTTVGTILTLGLTIFTPIAAQAEPLKNDKNIHESVAIIIESTKTEKEVKLQKPSLKKTNFQQGEQLPVMVSGEAELGFAPATATAIAPPPPPPVVIEPEVIQEEVQVQEVTPDVNRTAPASRQRTSPSVTAAPSTAPAPQQNSSGSSQSSAAAQNNNSAPAASTSNESAPSASNSSDLRDQIIAEAYTYVGTPYGTGPGQLDCSGFTQVVFAKFGIDLPRSSSAQRNAGTVVSASEARPGDLVWWSGHVGIYLGDGQYIAARNPSSPLHASPMYRDNPTYIRVVSN